jgi:hypothetical protein
MRLNFSLIAATVNLLNWGLSKGTPSVRERSRVQSSLAAPLNPLKSFRYGNLHIDVYPAQFGE